MSDSPTTAPPPVQAPSRPPDQAMLLLRGVPAAIIGAHLGFLVFWWLVGQGFYGIMLIGAAAGLLAGLAARGKSQTLAVVCLVVALVVSIFAEWKLFPFVKDKSLAFFLTHLHHVMPVHLIFIGCGAAAAYWFGQGR